MSNNFCLQSAAQCVVVLSLIILDNIMLTNFRISSKPCLVLEIATRVGFHYLVALCIEFKKRMQHTFSAMLWQIKQKFAFIVDHCLNAVRLVLYELVQKFVV